MSERLPAVDALWHFFDRMAEWERNADLLYQREGPAAKKTLRAELKAIFDRLTVADEEGRGREVLCNHSIPPEYDRSRWSITGIVEREDGVVDVEVRDATPQMAEVLRFTLRFECDSWLVVKRVDVRVSEISEQEEL